MLIFLFSIYLSAKISKPSVWVVVPLVLNRIQKEVEKELKKSQLKSAVFNLSISLSQRLGSMNPMNFVFSRIREGLGGNVKVIVCAGALLDRSVASFIERTTDARVIQGYGMTEGLCFLAHLTDKEFHCGRPMPGMKAVLKDVPDMDYWSEKNQGEICYKGTNCFAGYYHNKEETDKSFDSDGYLMSGDIGQIDEVIFDTTEFYSYCSILTMHIKAYFSVGLFLNFELPTTTIHMQLTTLFRCLQPPKR